MAGRRIYYHVIAENASTTNPAKLLAVFVVDTGQTDSLVTVSPAPQR